MKDAGPGFQAAALSVNCLSHRWRVASRCIALFGDTVAKPVPVRS